MGNVAQLGAHRAVGSMVTHPAASLSNAADILFTMDAIDDAFEVAAFAVIGVGMLAFAVSAAGSGSSGFWIGSTIAIGIVMPVTSLAYLADRADLIDLLLLLGGVVLLPAWLVATGRRTSQRSPCRSPNADARTGHPAGSSSSRRGVDPVRDDV